MMKRILTFALPLFCAPGLLEAQEAYVFPKKTAGLSADWTEDYGAAVEKAAREGKLVYVAASSGAEYFVSGNGGKNIWGDPALQKYMRDGFVCVMVSLDGYGKPNSARPGFAKGHGELIKKFKMSGFPSGWIVDPKTGEWTDRRPFQKTALGLMDDFEISKEKLVPGYRRKKIVDDPDAVLEPSADGKKGKYVQKVNSRPEQVKGWEDDLEKAEGLALKRKVPVLVVCSMGGYVENLIKDSAFFTSRETMEYLKRNLVCVKIGMDRPQDVGVYKTKIVGSYTARGSPFKERHDRFLTEQKITGYPVCLLYNPKNGKSAGIPLNLSPSASLGEFSGNVERAGIEIGLGK